MEARRVILVGGASHGDAVTIDADRAAPILMPRSMIAGRLLSDTYVPRRWVSRLRRSLPGVGLLVYVSDGDRDPTAELVADAVLRALAAGHTIDPAMLDVVEAEMVGAR